MNQVSVLYRAPYIYHMKHLELFLYVDDFSIKNENVMYTDSKHVMDKRIICNGN